eukprot:14271_4
MDPRAEACSTQSPSRQRCSGGGAAEGSSWSLGQLRYPCGRRASPWALAPRSCWSPWQGGAWRRAPWSRSRTPCNTWQSCPGWTCARFCPSCQQSAWRTSLQQWLPGPCASACARAQEAVASPSLA